MAGRRNGQDGEGGRWAAGIEKARDATAYAWIDLEATHEALTHAIAVYTLSLLVSGDDKSGSTRRQLNDLQGWLDSVRCLRTCRLWLKARPPGFELQFEFGAVP